MPRGRRKLTAPATRRAMLAECGLRCRLSRVEALDRCEGEVTRRSLHGQGVGIDIARFTSSDRKRHPMLMRISAHASGDCCSHVQPQGFVRP